jgi:hypothetical protein
MLCLVAPKTGPKPVLRITKVEATAGGPPPSTPSLSGGSRASHTRAAPSAIVVPSVEERARASSTRAAPLLRPQFSSGGVTPPTLGKSLFSTLVVSTY